MKNLLLLLFCSFAAVLTAIPDNKGDEFIIAFPAGNGRNIVVFLSAEETIDGNLLLRYDKQVEFYVFSGSQWTCNYNTNCKCSCNVNSSSVLTFQRPSVIHIPLYLE
jgi:hypothetical protein